MTAQNKNATRALGAKEPIEILKMEDDDYFEMFMYHALPGSSIADYGTYKVIGRKIMKKLHGSPIAAVTVAAQLSTDTDIEFLEKNSEG